VVSLLPQLIWHLDEPVADTAFITTYLVSKFAREDVTVILSGVAATKSSAVIDAISATIYIAASPRFRLVRGIAMRTGRRLPADRHSPLLNVARYAKAFLAAADLPSEERYSAFLQVHARADSVISSSTTRCVTTRSLRRSGMQIVVTL
jgi:asparagine synthase (glutamine-hydrolysing)